MRIQSQPFFIVFLGLALFGFLWQLFTDTEKLLYDILFLVLVILIGWGIYRYVMRRSRYTAFHGYRYPRTKGTSAKTPFYSQKILPSSKRAKSIPKRKTKPHPFTVIEGNKGKRKV